MIRAFGLWSFALLFHGLTWTVGLSLIAFVGGSVCGLLFAIGRSLGPAWLKFLVATYIEFIQATPLLILLFLCFYGLSFLGFYFSPLAAAAISLTLYSTAFLADIWRGCIDAIPRTQWEAADSLALSRIQKLRYVILPQALRIARGPTVGFFVQIVKNTSVAALIGFVELTRAGQLLNSMTFQPFAVFLSVAGIYFLVCFPMSRLSERLEGGRHAGAAN
jgi:polar amino acid transport system permease protein